VTRRQKIQPRKRSSARGSAECQPVSAGHDGHHITCSPATDPANMTGYTNNKAIFARHSDFELIQNELQCTVGQ
jgi:hypothetical protein